MKHHVDVILENLSKDMPPVCSREAIERFTGGLIRRRHLANLDSAGRGPSGKVRLGKRTIGYERQAFLLWLAEHLTSTDQASPPPASEGRNTSLPNFPKNNRIQSMVAPQTNCGGRE